MSIFEKTFCTTFSLTSFAPDDMLTIYIVVSFRGGSRISGKGVHMYKDVWVRFADFISFFLNIL